MPPFAALESGSNLRVGRDPWPTWLAVQSSASRDVSASVVQANVQSAKPRLMNKLPPNLAPHRQARRHTLRITLFAFLSACMQACLAQSSQPATDSLVRSQICARAANE